MTSTQPRTAAFLQREHVAYDATWVAFAEGLETENAALRAFVQRVAGQKPEKPDYWTPCGQCGHNASDAEDLLEDISPL